MVWFRVDDGWHKHRKRIRTGLDMEGMAAQGLWAAAGSWSGDELADGFVPDDMVDYLAPGIGKQLALRLERARLWIRAERDGEEGWQFWQWEDQQPTAEEVTAALSRKSTGGKLGNHRRWHVGEGKTDPRCQYCRDDAGDVGAGGSPDDGGNRYSDRLSDRRSESDPNPPTRPDPTRPDPELPTEVQETCPPATPSDALFDAGRSITTDVATKPPRKRAKKSDPVEDPKWFEFWYDAYPIKDGRIPALAAWNKAVSEKKIDPDVIIAGARRYRDRMARLGTERSHIKHAQGWLNDQRWEDEPTPPENPDAWGANDQGRASDGLARRPVSSSPTRQSPADRAVDETAVLHAFYKAQEGANG